MKESILKPVGLYTFPSQFSSAPPGAMSDATNVVIDRDGIVTTRRGFDNFTVLGSDVTKVTKLVSYQEHLVAACERVGTESSVLQYLDSDSVFQRYTGSFEAPSPEDPTSRINFVQSNKNLYFTSYTGVQKLDAYTGPIVAAGAPRGLGGVAVTTGTSGFLPAENGCAYRVVCGYEDQNENQITGVPSQRITVVNTSTTKAANVQITFQIPERVDALWYYQIYRSANFQKDITPDDELQLVYEGNPTSEQIVAGEVVYTDTMPADLRQATLYTSPSISTNGMADGNYEPPFANFVTYFKNCVIYANTRLKHNLMFNLVSVGSPGLQSGDTLTFTAGSSTFTLTAGAATNTSTGTFKLYTSGTPAENIEDTALEIVRVINVYAANTFLDAFYSSSIDEIPGKIEITRDDLTDVKVSVTSNRGNAFSPTLPTSGSNISTSADTGPNRVYLSKPMQPESVPLYRTFDVGSSSFPIKGIYALRDSVIIVKPDGVYRLYGNTFENMAVSLLDNTTEIVAPNSATVLSNLVFLFSSSGVVAVSDSGIKIMSRAIENLLLELSRYDNFAAITHAVGYESDRKYILWTLSNPTDTVATQAFVYNLFTDSWTRWQLTVPCSYVNPVDNKLYLSYFSDAGNAAFAVERKSFTRLDYSDDSFTVQITDHLDVNVTLSSTNNVFVGMTLKQGDLESVITAINGNQLTLEEVLEWSNASAEVFTPIFTQIQTIPISGRSPLQVKRFTQLNLLFGDANFDSVDVEFKSDLYTTGETVTLYSRPTLGLAQRIRTYVPRNYTYSNFIQLKFTLNQAFASFSLNGYALDELPVLTRIL
jgi:hypothetical protein